MSFATIIDTDALLQTIAAALVAGVGVTLIFALAIRGAVRFGEANREGHAASAAVFGVLTLVCLAAVAAAITFGIIVMSAN
jgi:hypothetical protein